MKSKIYTIISCFIIFTMLLMSTTFAVDLTAEKRVNENTDDYTDGALIYGSTRFDPTKVITAEDSYNAGVNEARLYTALGKSLADIKPVTPYFYDGESWYIITKNEEQPAEPIEDEKEVEKIEKNLNIFFVDNVEKTIEVKYEGDVNKESISNNVKYDEEKGVFVVTATTFNFTFEDSNGVETKVNTNVDTNLKIEDEQEHEKAEIKRNPEVTFKLAKEIVAGEATEFTVSTVANDYEGVMVVGTGSVNPDNVLKLEYAVGDLWVEMTGESLFGNDGAGFPLQNATSKFRVTFDKAGEYDVTFAIKNLETDKIMADVATKTSVTTTKNVNTLEELETALLNKYITNINILSDIETDHSILVGRKVTINGNNKTISFKEMPKEWITDGNNYVLKVYNTEATISDIKLTNSLAGLWVGSSKVTLVGEIDVTGNKMGGIDVSKSSNEGMPNSTLTVNGTIKRDDEAIDKPIMWLENEQASLVDTNKLFVANTNIPGAFALNQTYYYSSADVYKNVEVSTAEELETAMLLSDVENITLINNIELANKLDVNKKVLLNLNGKNITAVENFTSMALIVVWENGTLTIDGEGTVNSASQGNDYSMAIWAYNGGKLIINGGTYTNKGAKAFEGDGTSANKPNNNELIYASYGGIVTINGGKFIGNTENPTHGTTYTLNKLDNDGSEIIVMGGTFIEYDPANSNSENPTGHFVPQGYVSEKAEDSNVYVVTSTK